MSEPAPPPPPDCDALAVFSVAHNAALDFRRSTVTAPASRATAARLGVLAVVPFVAGAAVAWAGDPGLRPFATAALSAYAAVVIAFIGAIHWGLGFAQERPAGRLFVWGVVPSIVAWAALLLPPRTGLAIHAAMLVTCYVVDRVVYPREGVADWLPLRGALTLAATLCCLAGAAAG